MYTTGYIYKKEIDWSVCRDGFTIPVKLQVLLHEKIGQYLKKGDIKKIKIILEGEFFDVNLVNILFDENKYKGHKELLQIRYSYNSPFAKKIRELFYVSYEYILNEKEKQINKRTHIKIPDEIIEYLAIYSTDNPDVFFAEAITDNDNTTYRSEIENVTEEEFESYTNIPVLDDNARIEAKNKLIKIRKLDRSIAENLKALYDYRCQITGDKFGLEFGTEVSEAHHIDPFTKSLNNDSDNIIILSPNYHRLIHKANPVFDRKKLSFVFPNGLEEKVRLNFHL